MYCEKFTSHRIKVIIIMFVGSLFSPSVLSAQLDSVMHQFEHVSFIGYINADCLSDTLKSSYSTTGTWLPQKICWGLTTTASQNICTSASTYVPDSLKVTTTHLVFPALNGLQVSMAVDTLNSEDSLADIVLYMNWHVQDSLEQRDTSRAVVIFGQKQLITIATIDVGSIGITQVYPFLARELQIGDELIDEEPRDLTDASSYFFNPTIGLPIEITLDARVLLEGPFDGVSAMYTFLEQQDFLPLQHPFNVSPFYYTGNESMSTTASLVSNIVDWVLVDIRKEATTATLGRKAGLLREDGKIVDMDGVSNLFLPMLENPGDSCYLIIRHWNHLAIMSAVKITAGSNNVATYDFTGSTSATFATTGVGIKQLGATSLYGMVAGDVNSDNQIDAVDRTQVINDSGLYGYYRSDCTLDGIINALDRVRTRNNTFYTSQVP